jgi:hypothetical protein
MAATALNARPKRRSRRRADQESTHAAHVSAHVAHHAHESHFTPGSVLHLQQLIGNQAVQRLMRQDVDTVDAPPTTGLLSPSQVSKALAFYKAQPARYTPDIIMEIQFAVGSVPTGKMTAADVQLVAKKQEELNVDAEPKLKIDGMAGPRTLPTIFKFGLAEDDSVSDYTKKAKAVWDNKDGKSEEDKALEVVNELLNKRLEALNIPIIEPKVVDDLGSRGAFNPADWQLKLDRLQFKPGRLHDLRETTATIYHEGRHAEQDFRVGQMLARKGKNAQQINVQTGLRVDIAQKAFDTRESLTPMQALIAEGWFESENSDAGRETQRKNNEKIKATFKAREAACEVFKKDQSPANKAKLEKAKADFKQAVEEHDDMPHEYDAERLESRVKELFGPGELHEDDICK